MSRAQPFELAGLGRPLQDLLAGHAFAQDLAGRRHVTDPIDVAPADLERAQAEHLGDSVEVGLGGELDLRRPEPAKRAVGRRVGAGGACADPDVRDSDTGRRRGMAPRDRTTGVSVQYAPPSMTISISWATSRPSRVTPVRWRTIAGCRLVVALRSSWRS